MEKMSRILLLPFLLLLLASCASKSLEGYHDKGAKIILSLIETLEEIHTREELIAASADLKELFNSLVKTIIAAQEYQEKYSDIEPLELMESDHERSEWLRMQLQRIYRIEGCKEILEKCQQEALNMLDAHQQQMQRRRGLRNPHLR